jgi:alpha-galactosidase
MRKYLSIALALFLNVITVSTLENGLARTPQMGWNTWNKFGCGINENLIKATADYIVQLGLNEVGY